MNTTFEPGPLADVERRADGDRWTLLTLQPERALATLFADGVAVERLEVTDAGLEEAFVALTHHDSPDAPRTGPHAEAA